MNIKTEITGNQAIAVARALGWNSDPKSIFIATLLDCLPKARRISGSLKPLHIRYKMDDLPPGGGIVVGVWQIGYSKSFCFSVEEPELIDAIARSILEWREHVAAMREKHAAKVEQLYEYEQTSQDETQSDNIRLDAFRKMLDADAQDALCDKMDSFRRFMYSDILALQAKMIRCFPATLPAKDKQVVSAALLINRIARIAQDAWYSLYYVNGRRTESSGLNVVLGASRSFAKAYTKGNGDWLDCSEIYEERMKDLMDGLTVFRKKCMQFINFDRQQENQ